MANGTVLVRDVRPGTASGVLPLRKLAVLDGEVLFSANDGVSGVEPWKSDGTTSETVL